MASRTMSKTSTFYNPSRLIVIGLSSLVLLSAPASGDDETANSNTDTTGKPVVSIDALNTGGHDKDFSLGTVSDYADRNGNNIDQAITLCRKAIEKDDDDIDLHLHYAELLERKYVENGKSDSTLYMDCVKEWLIVLRAEAGDERGLTFHGVGLPFTGQFYKDEHRVILARKHLVSLTGVAPKGWETDAKYLQRVSKQSSVGGKILPKQAQTNSPPKENIAM